MTLGINVSAGQEEISLQPETVMESPLAVQDGTTPLPALSPPRPSSLMDSERESM